MVNTILVLILALCAPVTAAIIDGFDLPTPAATFNLSSGSPTYNLVTSLGGGVNRDFTATFNGTGTVAGLLGAGSFSVAPTGGATPQVDIIYTFSAPVDFSSFAGIQILATFADFFVPARISFDTATGLLIQSGTTSTPSAGPYTFTIPFSSLIGPGNLNAVQSLHVVVGNATGFFSTNFTIDSVETFDAVPEPSTALLILVPLAGMAWLRRRP